MKKTIMVVILFMQIAISSSGSVSYSDSLSSIFGLSIKDETWSSINLLDEWDDTVSVGISNSTRYISENDKIKYKKETGKNGDINREIIVTKNNNLNGTMYKLENGKILYDLYMGGFITVGGIRYNNIKYVIARFDKKEKMKLYIKKSKERESTQNEMTGDIYPGYTEISIIVTDELIKNMKKHNLLEIMMPNFNEKEIRSINLKGFSKTYNNWIKK